MIQSELANNALNLMPHYVDDYIDFLRLFVNESEIEYKTLKDKKEGRVAKLATGDDSSPYYLYTQAELFLRWAFIEIKFGDVEDMGNDLKRAFSLIEQNKKKFPDFMPNKKTSGLVNMLASTLAPSTRKSLGLNTSMKSGNQEMLDLIAYGLKNPSFEFNQETKMLYALMLAQLGSENPTYWKAITETYLDYKTSPMAGYALAITNLRSGNSSKVAMILDAVPKSDDYYTIDFFEYLRGLCKLYKFDAQAVTHFNNYINRHDGAHYIKDAYQKIAWSYLSRGDEANYTHHMATLLKKGDIALDCDAIAQDEALRKTTPNAALLKAQLQFEGGYYEEASKALLAIDEASLKTVAEKLDYNYFFARTYHRMRQYDNAIKYYTVVVGLQKNSTHYYVCNACLQLGLIYESRKETEKAKEFYNACLKLSPTRYKAILHGQAQGQLSE